MAFRSTDEILRGLAKSIDKIEFDQRPGITEKLKFQSANKDIFPNCYQSVDGFQIKLWLAGAQRIIGTSKDLEKAVRFADAAILFFWPYRKSARAPMDSDFTFGVASATRDCVPARKLLAEIGEHLKQTYQLSKYVRPVKPVKNLAQAREDVATAWKKFSDSASVYWSMSDNNKPVIDMLKAGVENLGKIVDAALKV